MTRGLALRLDLAGAALLWERVLPALLPALGIVAGFTVLALFDLLAALPYPLHLAIEVALGAALCLMLWRGLRPVRLPSRAERLRRLERDSGLAHRPLAALEDDPVGADPIARALWSEHRRRLVQRLGRLKVGWPDAALNRHDPYALRAGFLLLLLVGWIVAGPEAGERLRRALFPVRGHGTAGMAASADLWITPPAYTGLAPIYLRSGETGPSKGGPIRVPTGSTALVQVHGVDERPELTLDDVSGGRFAALDATDFTLETRLGPASRLEVAADGTTLLRVDLAVEPDQPPTVRFAKPPWATLHGALGLAYAAADDYGVKAVRLEIRPVAGQGSGIDTKAATTVDLPVASPPQQRVAATDFPDLTADPLAGRLAAIRLVAADALGQTGASAPFIVKLPEHLFHNPLAKLVASERSRVLRRTGDSSDVAMTLKAVAQQPEMYHQDPLVFLALEVASHQLAREPPNSDDTGVAALMWETALRIDDGALSDAQRQLRNAEAALQQALADRKSGAEIDKLMHQMQQAMGAYLQSLIQQGMQQGAQPGQQTGTGGNARSVSVEELARMMAEAQALAHAGDAEGARQKLAELQEMLESLRAGGGGSGGQGNPALGKLGQLQQQQRQLMDRSFQMGHSGRESGEGGSGEADSGSTPGARGEVGRTAAAQQALRRALERLMQGMPGAPAPDARQAAPSPDQAQPKGEPGPARAQGSGQTQGQGGGGASAGDAEIGQALERARQAMQSAEGALRRGDPNAALAPQGEALDALGQAGRALARQAGGAGGPADGGDSNRDAGRDPLGRDGNGAGAVDRGEVALPTKSDLQRSREILDELRRRASEYGRPEDEREYIERLLQDF